MMNAMHANSLPHASPTRLRLPNGRSVFGLAKSREETKFLYREIFEDRCYERHGIDLPEDAIVIDVGANIGLFALRITDLVPKATVFCFEPVPPTFECLIKNTWQRPGVVPYRAALMASARSFEVTFYTRAPANSTFFPDKKAREFEQMAEQWTLKRMWQVSKLGSVLMGATYPLFRLAQRVAFDRMLAAKQTFQCEAITLDQLFQARELARVDLLKVDVEGAECDVFEGLSEANLARVRQIVTEISADKKAWLPSFEARLRQAGFQHLTLASGVPGGDPRSDAFPCNLYARREAS